MEFRPWQNVPLLSPFYQQPDIFFPPFLSFFFFFILDKRSRGSVGRERKVYKFSSFLRADRDLQGIFEDIVVRIESTRRGGRGVHNGEVVLAKQDVQIKRNTLHNTFKRISFIPTPINHQKHIYFHPIRYS